MTLDQMRVLDAVVQAGSFRGAAERLNRAQSAISYAIRELETALGLTLFDRGGYRPKLTPEGHAVLRKARVVLEEVDDLGLLGERLAEGEEPLVRFDITPIYPIDHLLPVLRDLGRDYPRTRMQIGMEVLGGEELVAADEVDLALSDVFRRISGLEIVEFPPIPLVPVVAADHPLGQDGRTVTRGVLLDQVQIVISSSSEHLRDQSAGVVEGAPSWNVNDFPTKLKLLLTGMGWGFMPAYMVADALADGRLRQLNLPMFESQAARIGLVRKRRKAHGPVAVDLWNRLLTLKDKNPSAR